MQNELLLMQNMRSENMESENEVCNLVDKFVHFAVQKIK